jgi:DNA mismatch repair protein MutL
MTSRSDIAPVRVLPEDVANKIAAGEVVERPASVVKELVENALDARATRIIVRLVAAGRRLIEVIDNGHGMSEQNALLAIERHATSKIRKADDLESVASMGFRGEALPSIGAVSQFELVTRREKDDHATRIRIDGGILRDVEQVGAPPGTRATVNRLYFNTPVRAKFLKGVTTELSHCIDIVQRHALARPGVGFQFFHNEKLVFEVPEHATLRERIALIWGMSFVRDMAPLDAERAGFRFHGFIGLPGLTRAARSHQFFFLNRRPIVNRPLQYGFEDAYRGLVTVGRFPVGVVIIETHPRLVDVNIHPSKREVRFRDERVVRGFARDVVRDELARLAPRDEPAPAPKPESQQDFLSPDYVGQRVRPREQDIRATGVGIHGGDARGAEKEHGQDARATVGDHGQDARATEEENGRDARATAEEHGQDTRGTEEDHGQDTLGTAAPPGTEPVRDVSEEERAVLRDLAGDTQEEFGELAGFDTGRVAPDAVYGAWDHGSDAPMQLFDTYLLVPTRDRLLIIDQHALHERLNYDALAAELRDRDYESQQLVVPLVFDVAPAQVKLLEAHLDLFSRLGIEIEPFGGNSFQVTAICPLYEERQITDLVFRCLDELAQGDLFDREDVMAGLLRLATRACKASVRAGDVLTPRERQALIEGFRRLRPPYTCPHGRPIITELTQRQMEKSFRRIQ